MRAFTTTLTLVAALATPACAMQSKPGSREEKLVQFTVATFMADNICPNVIVNAPVAEATLKGLGWTDAMKTDPILRADVNELLLSSREHQEASCREIEANYGPSGKLVRDLVKPRGTPSTMAGRFPVRSPEGQAISIRAVTNFVHTSCPTLDVDKEVGWKAFNALGVKKEAPYDDSMDADISVQIRVYKANPDGCGLAWKHFGDHGDVFPNLLTRQR